MNILIHFTTVMDTGRQILFDFVQVCRNTKDLFQTIFYNPVVDKWLITQYSVLDNLASWFPGLPYLQV